MAGPAMNYRLVASRFVGLGSSFLGSWVVSRSLPFECFVLLLILWNPYSSHFSHLLSLYRSQFEITKTLGGVRIKMR